LSQDNTSSSRQLKPSMGAHTYSTNGHTPQLSPLRSPTGSGEIHGSDTTQRKRKWSSDIGRMQPTPSSGLAGDLARSADRPHITPGQASGIAMVNLSHHKRNKVGHISNLLPRNSVASVPWDKSSLPGEIWQRVFAFVPPASLGRLLRVNRVFKALLTPEDALSFQGQETHGSLKFQSPNSVWTASRRLYCPSIPRPLASFTEHRMWKLVRNPNCQFCGKTGPVSPELSTSPWEAGPGDQHVRIIWSFGVRSCGKCLMERTEKVCLVWNEIAAYDGILKLSQDLDLMFSSVPSILLTALPCIFLTQSHNVISPVTYRSSNPPQGIHLVKCYFKPHIKDIQQRLEEVKAMGTATAEEWVKGLETAGKEKLADAARWEQWEANGGLRALNSRHTIRPKESDPHPSSLPAAASQLPRSAAPFGAAHDSGSGHSTPNTNAKSANDSSNASPARTHFPQGRITSKIDIIHTCSPVVVIY
jgi:hypothetical protein